MNITTERIDDFPLLLEVMQRLGLPGIIDNHLRRHGLHRGLSWGWIATIWLAHILCQSNPRKQPVQSWVRQAHETIERITRMKVNELDFTDDRLTLLLRRLSKPEIWQAIETELGRSILRVYELKPERVRLDATTVSGYHASGEEMLFQYGHSKDDPSLAQVKVMVAKHLAEYSNLVLGGGSTNWMFPWSLEQLVADQRINFRFYEDLDLHIEWVAGGWPEAPAQAPPAPSARGTLPRRGSRRRGCRRGDAHVVFGAERQKAFKPCAGMFGTLTLKSVGKKKYEIARLLPFDFGTGDEIVDNDLRRIRKVPELSFPEDQG